MSGNIQQQRAAVEQLRREENIKRISVSQAVEDIKVRFVQRRFILLQALTLRLVFTNILFQGHRVSDNFRILGAV